MWRVSRSAFETPNGFESAKGIRKSLSGIQASSTPVHLESAKGIRKCLSGIQASSTPVHFNNVGHCNQILDTPKVAEKPLHMSRKLTKRNDCPSKNISQSPSVSINVQNNLISGSNDCALNNYEVPRRNGKPEDTSLKNITNLAIKDNLQIVFYNDYTIGEEEVDGDSNLENHENMSSKFKIRISNSDGKLDPYLKVYKGLNNSLKWILKSEEEALVTPIPYWIFLK